MEGAGLKGGVYHRFRAAYCWWLERYFVQRVVLNHSRSPHDGYCRKLRLPSFVLVRVSIYCPCVSNNNKMVHMGRLVASSAIFLAFFCGGHYLYIRDNAWERLPHGNALRALTDNVIHGLIGGWCWFNAALFMGEGLSTTLLAHIAVSMLMASAIDIDHFVAARSLSLKVRRRLFLRSEFITFVSFSLHH